MSNLRWVTVLVCGTRRFNVDVCNPLPGGDWGDCTYKTNLIRVKLAAPTLMEDTSLHEITHAIWDTCGLKAVLCRRLSNVLTPTQIYELEEDIISIQTPGVLATLQQAGWLTLPSFPRKGGT